MKKRMSVELSLHNVERYHRETLPGGKLYGQQFWPLLDGLLGAYMDLIDNGILEGTKGLYSFGDLQRI